MNERILRIRPKVAGHETQYLLQEAQSENEIVLPSTWKAELSEILGENWTIWDRDTRFDVTPPNGELSTEAAAKLTEAIKTLITKQSVDKFTSIHFEKK